MCKCVITTQYIPTAFSLMISCALVLAAADIVGLLTPAAKKRRRNEIFGGRFNEF